MNRENSDSSSSSGRDQRINPLDWPQQAGQADAVAAAVAGVVRQRRRKRATSLAVAGVAVLALGFGFIAWRSESGGPLPGASVAVDAAARAIVSSPLRRALPDGSTVELRADAEIEVGFGSELTGFRRVTLKRGEAHFTVAKNPARPFVVVAGGVEVRAVGTAFAVQYGGASVEVLVTEGRVALEQAQRAAQGGVPQAGSSEVFLAVSAAQPDGPVVPRAAEPEPLAFVDAGNRARINTETAKADAHVSAVTPAELSERLSWRVPRLEFNATPLSEVVALFNQHARASAIEGRPAALRLGDAGLHTLPLSGTLRADNLPVLLQILETSYAIKAERTAGGEIVLRKSR